jgi:hypothetical protein
MKQSGSAPRSRGDARRRGIPAAAALALCAGLLAACGSSSPTAPSASPAAQTACLHVSGALSDGPDPDADPVGYAEAQILPLHQIHTSDKAIGSAISRLASAYAQFYDDNGTKAGKSSVKAAAKTINELCPGVGAGI